MTTFKQLEAFHWITQLDGLENAARKLNTTQSTLVKRVRELEHSLGFKVFDKSGRRLRLNEHGKRISSIVEEILHLRGRLAACASKRPKSRTLRLGVTELTAVTWLSHFVERIRLIHPTALIDPVVDSSANLVEKLKASSLDMVIVPDSFQHPELQSVFLETVEFAWLCSPTYASNLSTIALTKLTDFTIIAQKHGSGLGVLIEDWLRTNSVTLHNWLPTSSLTLQASLTLSGLGIGYLPRKIADHFVATGQLQIVETTPSLPKIPYCVMYRKGTDEFLPMVGLLANSICDFTRSSLAPEAGHCR